MVYGVLWFCVNIVWCFMFFGVVFFVLFVCFICVFVVVLWGGLYYAFCV